MSLFGRLNLTALVSSFAIGVLFTYLVTPPPKVIVKFPSPFNAGRILYRDRSDTCYKFKSDAVDCSAHTMNDVVVPQPLLFEGFASM